MQLDNIGTKYLVPPRGRTDEDAAWRQTVGQMDIGQLRPFMCPKSHGDSMVCLDCNGFRNCTVGQRAIALLDTSTRPQEPQYRLKWKDGDKPSIEPKQPDGTGPHPMAVDQEEFRKACESGNPWNWLIEKGYSDGAAREKLVYWTNHYKAIAQEYGGKKRIMAKPKTVTVTKLEAEGKTTVTVSTEKPEKAPADAQEAREEASPAPEALTEGETEKGPETALSGKERSAAAHTRIGRAHCEEAMASGDPKQYLLDHGSNLHSATNLLSKWRQKYPDICEKYGYRATQQKGIANEGAKLSAEKALAFYEECFAQEDPVAWYMEQRGVSRRSAYNAILMARKRYGDDALTEPAAEAPDDAIRETEPAQDMELKPEPDDTDDEITLLDFLKEYGEGGKDDEKSGLTEQAAPGPEEAGNSDPMVRAMMDRGKELDAEKERLKGEIRQAEERIRCIDEQREALELCLKRFRG